VNFPDSIVDTFDVAIKRRSKIENAEITVPRRKSHGSGHQ